MHKNELKCGGRNLWYVAGQLLAGTSLYHQRQVDFVYGMYLCCEVISYKWQARVLDRLNSVVESQIDESLIECVSVSCVIVYFCRRVKTAAAIISEPICHPAENPNHKAQNVRLFYTSLHSIGFSNGFFFPICSSRAAVSSVRKLNASDWLTKKSRRMCLSGIQTSVSRRKTTIEFYRNSTDLIRVCEHKMRSLFAKSTNIFQDAMDRNITYVEIIQIVRWK